MNQAGHVMVDRIEAGLVPHVGEFVVLGALFELPVSVVATEGVQKQHAVIDQTLANSFEIGPQQFTGGEQVVTEVHRQDRIDRIGRCRHDVVLQQLDATCLVAVQFCKMMRSAPLQHIAIKIDADGAVVRTGANPVTSRVGRAAEILTNRSQWPSGQQLEGFADEFEFSFGILDTGFIEFVAVGLISHGDPIGPVSRH
jgi:hypothetical protein